MFKSSICPWRPFVALWQFPNWFSRSLSINQINQQIPIVDARIADLQKQLNDANAEKQGLLNDRARYQNLITNAPSIIRSLETTLNGLKNRLPTLQSQIDANKARCDGIQSQIDNLRNDISKT